MTLPSVLPYVIMIGIIIAVGCILIRILFPLRRNASKSGSLAGLAMFMMVLVGMFRGNIPEDKKKVTRLTSKKETK